MLRMLRQPLNGFAKRVDDTVARAMTILHSREGYTAKPVDRALLRPLQERTVRPRSIGNDSPSSGKLDDTPGAAWPPA
jgi:hypothetical protein